MVAPLLIGLAAGALGFVLGGLRPKEQEKKEEPAPPPPPDPRIDQIAQSQQRQEALLNQLIGMNAAQQQNPQQPPQLQPPGGPFAPFGGQASPYAILQNPAAMNAAFGCACTPGQFYNTLENLLSRLPPPCSGAEMFFVAGARCS